MTSREALERLARPTGKTAPRRGFRLGIGDGDLCVTNPEHGRMYTVKGFTRQWCPNQRHDVDGSRSRWPYEDGFEAAIAQWRAAHPKAVTA
jgi:hypothetical protein